jgi:hypothetical protein
MISDAATMQIAHCSGLSSVVSRTRWSGPNVVASRIDSAESAEALSRVGFSISWLLKIVRSSSAVSSEKNRCRS